MKKIAEELGTTAAKVSYYLDYYRLRVQKKKETFTVPVGTVVKKWKVEKCLSNYCECKCINCGAVKQIRLPSIADGVAVDCPCITEEQIQCISPRSFANLKKGAESRSLPFAIVPEDINSLLNKQDFKCIYSKLPIDFHPDNLTASVDRLDSRYGYLPENLQLVHKFINMYKVSMQEEVLLHFAQLIGNNTLPVETKLEDFKIRNGRIGYIPKMDPVEDTEEFVYENWMPY